MRKYYLDNVRWITVVVVVLYHVLYMYNAEGILGGIGNITHLSIQYCDIFLYAVYPWIMMVLFMVSGISVRLALNKYTHKEFIRSRTTKLLVPWTVGLFAFQFIQGYVNISLSGMFSTPGIPLIFQIIAILLSGVGVLWYIQFLWLFSIVLILIIKIEKDKLWEFCGKLGSPKIGVPVLIAMVLPVFLAAQVLNAPVVLIYRFGLYFFVFLFGYFILSHDNVINVLKKWFALFGVIAVVFGFAFCITYFGQNYSDSPVYNSICYVFYGYFACLSIMGGIAKYFDISNRFTQWMNKRSFGLYVFHYLGISSVALYIAKPGYLPAFLIYVLSLIAGFGGGYLLNEIISHIPYYRWAVLGIKEPKKKIEK